MNYNVLMSIGSFLFVFSFIGWFGFLIIIFFHAKRNKESLSLHFYGYPNFYNKGIDKFDIFFMNVILVPLFIQYHLIYKRKGYLPMFKKGAGPIFPNLDEKIALSLIDNHYRFILLNFLALGVGLIGFIGAGILLVIAKNFAGY